MLASRGKVVAFVAIAFYFLIQETQTETSGFRKMLMLQHLKGSRRKRMVLLQIALKILDELVARGHGREISSGLRAFCKEISWKIGGKKISGYQGVHLSTLFEWLARI